MKGEKRFRTIWIWIVFVGFVLFSLSANSDITPHWNPAEQLIIDITAPFQKFTKKTIQSIEKFWLDYFYLVDVRRENMRLQNEIDAYRMENSRYREMLATHQRLQALLKFKERIDEPAVAAQVIARDPTGWFRSVIIDKGKRSGLKWDMPVVNASGVVGRVVSVSAHYAKVLLIIDQNSAVDCLDQRTRDRGMVKGLSTEVCEMDYVAESAGVAEGDLVVTSGLGGVFPKGLPVGIISNVSKRPGEFFKHVEVLPSVDFSKLEEVLVVLRPASRAWFSQEKRHRKGHGG
ncbi:MAG: rod shape-determining protein MreC [Deltaproteobacteria bacterium]